MEKKWERNDKLKSRTRKITQSELNRENRPKKKNEQSFRDSWGYNKRSNILVTRPQKDRRKRVKLIKYSINFD